MISGEGQNKIMRIASNYCIFEDGVFQPFIILTASRQVPPGQLPPGQVPPGQVPLWTSSTSDKFPPDKFPFGQLSPGQVPLPGKHLKRTSSPRTTSPRTSSPTDNFPPDKFPWQTYSPTLRPKGAQKPSN